MWININDAAFVKNVVLFDTANYPLLGYQFSLNMIGMDYVVVCFSTVFKFCLLHCEFII